MHPPSSTAQGPGHNGVYFPFSCCFRARKKDFRLDRSHSEQSLCERPQTPDDSRHLDSNPTTHYSRGRCEGGGLYPPHLAQGVRTLSRNQEGEKGCLGCFFRRGTGLPALRESPLPKVDSPFTQPLELRSRFRSGTSPPKGFHLGLPSSSYPGRVGVALCNPCSVVSGRLIRPASAMAVTG